MYGRGDWCLAGAGGWPDLLGVKVFKGCAGTPGSWFLLGEAELRE